MIGKKLHLFCEKMEKAADFTPKKSMTLNTLTQNIIILIIYELLFSFQLVLSQESVSCVKKNYIFISPRDIK